MLAPLTRCRTPGGVDQGNCRPCIRALARLQPGRIAGPYRELKEVPATDQVIRASAAGPGT